MFDFLDSETVLYTALVWSQHPITEYQSPITLGCVQMEPNGPVGSITLVQ